MVQEMSGLQVGTIKCVFMFLYENFVTENANTLGNTRADKVDAQLK